jgi:PST family polysaccharide transporter
MLAEKLFKMVSQLLVLVLMARILPPHELGQLMYCFALASIFLFLNQLGLDTLLVKKLIDRPLRKVSLLWHALTARFCAAFLCVLLVNLLGLWLVEPQHRMVLFCISLYHLFLPFSTFEWFYQAEGHSERAAIGLILGQVFGLLIRLYAIFMQPDLLIFASAYVLEVAVTALAYVVMAKQDQLHKPTVLSMQRMQNLAREAFPLMISGAVILLYMKIDQVMLGYLASETELANYVAATRLSEAWFFFGLTVISAYMPKYMKILINDGVDHFISGLCLLTRYLLMFSAILIILVYIFSEQLIHLLYGAEYVASEKVLLIAILIVPCVYFGSVTSRLYIIEKKHIKLLLRSVFGLTVNVLLNFFCIPKYGALGAAYSMLISQFLVGIFFPLIDRNKLFLAFLKRLFG